MRKTLFLFIFCLISLVSVVYAEGNVMLTLRNVNTNEIVDDVVVYLDLNEEELIRYVESGQSLEMSLDDGVYDLVLQVDNPSTSGKDYFKKQTITVANGLVSDVYLFPASSLRGYVKDVFDNVVGNAVLKFECTDNIGVEFPLKTDNFGSFSVDYMPSCSCKISANFGEAVGFADVYVPQGNITDVEILLDRTILAIPESSSTVENFVFLLFIIAVVLLIIRYKKRILDRVKPRHEIRHHSVVHKEKNVHEVKSSRPDDIKTTLNKKEKDVVEFLTGKDEVNQSSVRHNLGIPRTSLSRVLASLEHKKIIHVKKVGKVVKIKLTNWFLGKE